MGTDPQVSAVHAFATAASSVTTASEALIVFVEAARAAERAAFGGSGPLHDLEHLSAVPGSRRMAPSRALV
jgi:hypothetical protein